MNFVKVIILMLFMFNAAIAKETLKIGVMFQHSLDQESAVKSILRDNSVKFERKNACDKDAQEAFIANVDVILGMSDDDCLLKLYHIIKEQKVLLILFPGETFSSLELSVIFPHLTPINKRDLKEFKSEYEKSGEILSQTKLLKTYRVYNATQIFLKIVEKSGLSPSKIEEDLEKQVKNVKSWLLKFRVVQVPVAPLRNLENIRLGENPQNRSFAVWHKGTKAIVKPGDKDYQFKYWIKVESFSDSTQVGWIHRKLVRKLVVNK